MIKKCNTLRIAMCAVAILSMTMLPACHKNPGIPAGVNAQLVGSAFKVGDDIEVRFTIGGLSKAAGDSLSGFDVNVLFDSTVLALKSSSFVDPDTAINQLDQTEPNALPFDGKVTDKGTGILDVYGVSGNQSATLDSAQANAFVFLTLTFTAIAASASTTITLDTADAGLLFATSNDTAMAQTYPTPGVEIEVQAP